MAVQHTTMSGAGGFAHVGRDPRAQRERRPVLHIVEDDRSTLSLLRDVAHDAGWEARGFTRLEDFEREVRTQRPDLVILDDDLPDGRGGDRARELRADPQLADVPVLVCTAAHPMRQAEITNWAPVVSKPFDLGRIEDFLNAAAQQRSHGRREQQAG